MIEKWHIIFGVIAVVSLILPVLVNLNITERIVALCVQITWVMLGLAIRRKRKKFNHAK